jgi:L-ascorbate metabolism protein UlaG (beta-lactamase superfamily)
VLPVDALLLTAHFSDHLHPETLAALPKDIPVFGTGMAARLARRLGFTRATALKPGACAALWPGLSITAVAPGFPYSFNSIGLLFEHEGERAYLETHMVNMERARALGRVDTVIAPVQSVRLLGIPFVMSPERALEVAKVLKPSTWLTTGDEPQLAHGLLSRALSYRGSVDDFRALVASAGLAMDVRMPGPGEAAGSPALPRASAQAPRVA